MLYDLSKRYDEDDRFMSNYVENQVNFDDKKIQSYRKVSEYWAEICRSYFGENSEVFKESDPKDSQIVEKWFNRINGIETKGK